MDAETFCRLPAPEVARLVRSAGPKVCVFPINGTRRWFLLEHPGADEEGFSSAYLDVIARRHIELYQIFFDHGVDTLLTPAFGPDILDRGEAYVQMAAEGLARLAKHPEFLGFFEAYGVRVRFYGDYARYFARTPYAHLTDLFDEVMARTAANNNHRLFFGLFAHDASETIAEMAVAYHAEYGRVPDKRALVERYYGEYVEPVDIFIGFDRFSAFDMPLVATGNEDLYFTVSPSPYLDERQLRRILYDHLYARRGQEVEYAEMSPADVTHMREFYRANLGRTMGVGAWQLSGAFWIPLPQVELPGGFAGGRSQSSTCQDDRVGL
jgi:tuberculosinol/isotuberculosinol synthase